MTVKKIQIASGVTRENTRYTSEGKWYESDKVRFRRGTPEKIGGWTRYSTDFFLGICRSLWTWITLTGLTLIGVGTNLKFYINKGGVYYDVTPLRKVVRPMLGLGGTGNPFTATTGSAVITVYDVSHGCSTNDFVTFSGAAGLGGNITASVLNAEYQVTVLTSNTYTFVATATANGTDALGSPGGGAVVVAAYQVNTGSAIQSPSTGWGGGSWGSGGWGTGATILSPLQLWSQNNFGESLVFGPAEGGLYYWNAGPGLGTATFTVTIAAPAVLTFTSGPVLANGTAIMLETTGALPTGLLTYVVYYVINSVTAVGVTTCNLSTTFGGTAITTTGTQSGTHIISNRGIPVTSLGGASGVPLIQSFLFVADTSRFVFVFGTNDYGSTAQDLMLIRWSDQESVTEWVPSATNQAGSIRLSHGSKIVACLQARQEIIVWTDSSIYALQYVGAPIVWQVQLVGDNISLIGPAAVALASGVVYWMGVDKFYMYDGTVKTLDSDLRKYVYQDINLDQNYQVFAGTNEGFNEVWWFYCPKNSTAIGKYVIYNYIEKVWYYGTMARTAWLDSGLINYPIAATYSQNIVNHELGVDDNETDVPAPISAYISSSEFDIDDGDRFMFVYRMLPDVSFNGSTEGTTAELTLGLYAMKNSGSGTGPLVSQKVDQLTGAEYTVTEGFTGQIYTRIRGRQMILKVSSDKLGTAWQVGTVRFDARPDGRR
tara:strand:- start:949 stop:3087 length:2139 start_codon:yes stop_codon:yes gene_type:complete